MYLTLDTICSKLKFNPVEKYSSELAHPLLLLPSTVLSCPCHRFSSW